MVGILKVDTIQNANASNIVTQTNSTTLTIGAVGQTINLPSGSTLQTDTIKNTNSSTIITQTNSTTLTIGTTGQTVALASGATSSGFGATYNGALNWDTTVKTTGFTAVSGTGYFVNTTSGAITVTLPATPSAGNIVGITDYAGTAATNNITIARNGSKIEGTTENAAISANRDSITLIYVDATQGWVPIADNTGNAVPPKFVTATGGTVTTCGNYKIHTFNSSGCFVVSCAGNSIGSTTVDYLVIAGGGGGGNYQTGVSYGGAAGAGGYRESVPSPAAWTASPLANPGGSLPVSVTTYPVTVGGGAGATSTGSNSIFSTITSAGGGYGYGAGPVYPGGPGGSGGSGYGTGNTPPVSPPQGNNGGGAGGGGADEAGDTDGLGFGGDGVSSSISGSSVTRGGGGGANNGPEGGAGDGGGGSPRGGAGTANTGGGGGAGGWSGAPGFQGGGSGGSGIVIIRYRYQ